MENILKEAVLIIVVLGIFNIPGIILLLFEDTAKLKLFSTAHNRFLIVKTEVNLKKTTKIGLFLIYTSIYVLPFIILQIIYGGIFDAGIIPIILMSVSLIVIGIFEYPYKRIAVKFILFLKTKFSKTDNLKTKDIN